MSKAVKNILALNHEEAMDFFLKFKQLHSFELMGYYYKLKGVLVEIERIVIRFSEQMVRNIDTVTRWVINRFSYIWNNLRDYTFSQCGYEGIISLV